MISKLREKLHGDDLLQRLVRGGLAALFIKVAGAVLSLAMFAALARCMSAADFGRFGFGFSLAMTLAMGAGLGLHTGILRWRPEYEASGDAQLAEAVERWGLNMTLVSGLMVGLALTTGALVFWALGVAAFAPGGRLDPGLLSGVGALIAVMGAAEFIASAMRARGATLSALAPRDVIWRAGVTAVCFGFVAAGVQRDPAQMLWLAAALLGVISLIQAVAAGLRPGRPAAQGRRVPALGASGLAGPWLARARAMWGTSVLGAVSRYFEVVLLGLFLAPAPIGAYFAALTLAQALMLVLVATNMVAAPLISRFHFSDDSARLQRMLRLIMLGVAPAALTGFAIVLLFGKTLLGIFDPAYQDAYAILVILSSGSLMNALFGPTDPLLNMTGHERRLLQFKVATAIGTVVAQVILIPIYGLWGAAGPNAAGILIWNLLARAECRKGLGLDPSAANLLSPLIARFRS